MCRPGFHFRLRCCSQAVMCRPGFHLVEGKAARERTSHHPHWRSVNRLLLMHPAAVALCLCGSSFTFHYALYTCAFGPLEASSLGGNIPLQMVWHAQYSSTNCFDLDSFCLRSFRECGPTIWNKPPQDLRSTDTREQFRCSLKHWLFECARQEVRLIDVDWRRAVQMYLFIYLTSSDTSKDFRVRRRSNHSPQDHSAATLWQR